MAITLSRIRQFPEFAEFPENEIAQSLLDEANRKYPRHPQRAEWHALHELALYQQQIQSNLAGAAAIEQGKAIALSAPDGSLAALRAYYQQTHWGQFLWGDIEGGAA